MNKGDVIHGYRILDDFRVVGGMSKVSFAEKGGKEYFIKEFLSPKYPTTDSPGSEKIKAQKRKACENFEAHHRRINSLIGTKVSFGGNLVYAVDFFREGTSYYKVNEKIDISSLSLKKISALDEKTIATIACSVCHSVSILHDLNIVHGDLKPDNILIKESKTPIGKLIDFDDSYFSANPPKDKDCVVGTPEYYSPELAAYITDEDDEIGGETLTLASDIFALGIIFCEYFTGKKPINDEGVPTWLAIEKGNPIRFAKSLNPGIDKLLRLMLMRNPTDRPSVRKVQQTLREIKTGKMVSDSELRGNGLKIATPAHKVESTTSKIGLRGKVLGKIS